MKSTLQVLLGVLLGFLLAALVMLLTRLPAGQPVALQPVPSQAPIVIQVVGEVTRPGVYSLPDGSRVEDAVNAAGGLLADADSTLINLAAKLEDGQQVVIPVQGGAASDASGLNPAPLTVVASLTPSPVPETGLVDINTATLQQLQALPGISPVTAQSIVTYRAQNGPFQTIEDIMNVPGIGPATFDGISSLITVGQ